MRRCTSPDITEGVPPPAQGPTEQRRSTRRRNPTAAPSPQEDSSSPITGGNSNDATPPTEGAKRGRGRGRPRGSGVRKGQSQDVSSTGSTGQEHSNSPNVSTTVGVDDSPNAGGGGVATGLTPQVQPKRRGRKPKPKENVEMVVGLVPSPHLEEAMVVGDTTVLPAPAGQSFTVPVHQMKAEPSTEPMEDGSLLNSSSLFSSVLKSETSFGQQSGGGIPGLDLDDCEANSATFSSEPVLTAAVPHIKLSFGGKDKESCRVEEECKNFQQMQLGGNLNNVKNETNSNTNSNSNNSNAKSIAGNNKNSAKSEDVTTSNTNNEESDSSKVRRSSRIKTLEEQRGPRGRRREVVSSLSDSISRSNLSLQEDDSNSNGSSSFQTSSGYSSPSRDSIASGTGSSLSVSSLSSFNILGSNEGSGGKPYKVKQRWRNSLDVESMKSFSSGDGLASSGSDVYSVSSGVPESTIPSDKLVRRRGHLAFDGSDEELLEKLKKFDGIDESMYRTERKISKENKGMVCDCYLSKDEIAQGEIGCTEDCLNRLLMVECGNKCPTGAYCSNRRFQKKEYAPLEVFKTEKKGHGLRTLHAIPEGGFVIEYVGEVLDVIEFERRTTEYAKGNHEHFYFMALKSDAIIDATLRGNCSRFINHSCEPNCETQKWTVNGEVRIGFFAITDLQPGDEITFDYQFQRYGKKAQRCFCLTESCRGWIGEEDDEAEYQVEDKEEPIPETETEVEENKAKPKPKVEKKKRKNVQLEDMAFREELLKLEASGLKNRNHTLTLSRLMVRAESWDDRERLLKILINGDTPCRRLFLDYHGLRLIWSWMVDLPLPQESDGPQLIRNDVYHMLFLRALQSLPIPNKSLLLESKVLSLVEKWCSVPSVTTTITLVKRTDVPAELKKTDSTSTTASESLSMNAEDSHSKFEKMDTSTSSDTKEEPTSTAEQMQELVEERAWEFVPLSKVVLDSWVDLKEVFRIPKKERVEQMKEHEREADKGLQLNTGLTVPTGIGTGGIISSYDRDSRNKLYRQRGERRVPVLDSSQQQFHRDRQPNRMMIPPGVSKEQWRKHFEETIKAQEQQEIMRKEQDSLVTLHQERCGLVGLDPATTPIVDRHGVYYLDPQTVEWKPINVYDPSMPPELIKFLQLSQYLPPGSSEGTPSTEAETEPVEPEQAFPPWPQGLPPPPPLPPFQLPKNWKMAVDDEGRCYYYHVLTKVTQWHPPVSDDASSTESSSEYSSEEEVVEEMATTTAESTEGSPTISKSKSGIQTWRSKMLERAEKRKKSGLVQERIISPRGDDDKGFSKEMVKHNKRLVQEEAKLARLKLKSETSSENESEVTTEGELSGLSDGASTSASSGSSSSKSSISSRLGKVDISRKASSSQKKRRKEKRISSSSKDLSSHKSKQLPPASKSASSAGPSVSSASTSSPSNKPSENTESSSPIETELDLTLSQLDEDNDGFFSKVSSGHSRIIGSTPSMELVAIPGLGFDNRDMEMKKKAERAARHAAKKKALHLQKKSSKEKTPVETSTTGSATGSATGSSNTTPEKKPVSSKEARSIQDAFRNSIASVVVSHLNPYRKNEQIQTNEDFKHLARKITHAILLKELKHTRDVASLEVNESVKHKSKEYIKKFMARFPNGIYVPSPENPQTK